MRKALKSLWLKLAARCKHFAKDEAGATAVEYAIIAACIGAACVVSATALGTAVTATLQKVVTAMAGLPGTP